ncbi:CRISPR-associated endonuclease Cas1 [Candidatus Roizmanbacteria bacterium]|nr:CRISPR-associated endonuclease Cas1 [Candidatus Roizmanbacteria bacterium]
MLTLPDFKEKKILLVNVEYGHHSLLQLVTDNIRFLRDGEVVNQISTHIVFAIFIVGDITITSSLLKKLTAQGISVFFLNHNLATKATVMAEAEGNFLLRQKQYAEENTLTVAQMIVKNKITNQVATLKKAKMEYPEKVFSYNIALSETADTHQELLGAEGNASKSYFQTLFADIEWVRRAPQTKEDVNNLLLDIGYTYLFNYCDALLRLFGFDVYKGVYHQLFFQRKSLVCDIMEPIRPIIDYQLLKSHRLKQIHKKDFVFIKGRYEFKEGFTTHKTYSSLFLDAINENKEQIYNYILGYYRYTMNHVKYPFPQFTI